MISARHLLKMLKITPFQVLTRSDCQDWEPFQHFFFQVLGTICPIKQQQHKLITLFSWLISASCSLVLPLSARLAFSVSERSFSSPLPSTGETLPSTAPLPKGNRPRPFAEIIGILDHTNVMFAQRCYIKQYLFFGMSWSKTLTFFCRFFGRHAAALINLLGNSISANLSVHGASLYPAPLTLRSGDSFLLSLTFFG